MQTFFRSGLVALAAGAFLLSGCAQGAAPSSNSGASSGTASSGMASPGAAAGPDLKTASSSLGQIIVDGKGMSVYVFDKDTKDSGKSSCSGSCAAAWPAVLTTSATPSVSGVTGKVGVIPAASGGKQLTVNGLPVYTFAQDKSAGDVKGQAVGNVWWLLNPAGEKVTSTAGSSTGGY
ncbi:hypothetical protein KIH31_02175 [Paenarthrobacter sp. DKR-5]|uniref:COG4315 family predicted lipoprotein n=1 Tax=Paenarthrobacter sp. DKR-5 TaxID=2835535 RepID=UPI001BDC9853|nr:hypothetical protein [Paenarthrobacter sp. DKR-5]MBT1001398.1 hypothetical protein [Paenarthrobacter sp. DKR-5]